MKNIPSLTSLMASLSLAPLMEVVPPPKQNGGIHSWTSEGNRVNQIILILKLLHLSCKFLSLA
jgi:hypothetical protein